MKSSIIFNEIIANDKKKIEEYENASKTDIVANDKKENKEWINKLMYLGIKAAHPDDGWVDRNKNEILFCYPYFKRNIMLDDKIVLGSWEKYRVVQIDYIKYGNFRKCNKYGFHEVSRFVGIKNDSLSRNYYKERE